MKKEDFLELLKRDSHNEILEFIKNKNITRHHCLKKRFTQLFVLFIILRLE